MRKNHVRLMAAGILILVFMTGCDLNGAVMNKGVKEIVSEDGDESGYNVGERENQNDTESEQSEKNKNIQSQSQLQTTASAEDMEKELAAYRAEREKGVSTIGNYTLGKLPSEENYKYGIGSSDSYTGRFDSRELNLVFKAADDYINGTLKLESEAWACVDPRMTAIYEDEDKGVANGYDADNIFLCEYNDNGKWQYLILVREKKGSDWKVLYHGSSYKTDERDGGSKK